MQIWDAHICFPWYIIIVTSIPCFPSYIISCLHSNAFEIDPAFYRNWQGSNSTLAVTSIIKFIAAINLEAFYTSQIWSIKNDINGNWQEQHTTERLETKPRTTIHLFQLTLLHSTTESVKSVQCEFWYLQCEVIKPSYNCLDSKQTIVTRSTKY